MKTIWEVSLNLKLVRYEGEWDQTQAIPFSDIGEMEESFTFKEFTDLDRASTAFHQILDTFFRTEIEKE